LSGLHRAVLEGIRRHPDGQVFVLAQLDAFEVIGEEQFGFLRDQLRRFMIEQAESFVCVSA